MSIEHRGFKLSSIAIKSLNSDSESKKKMRREDPFFILGQSLL